jgi:hypothetical protein
MLIDIQGKSVSPNKISYALAFFLGMAIPASLLLHASLVSNVIKRYILVFLDKTSSLISISFS